MDILENQIERKKSISVWVVAIALAAGLGPQIYKLFLPMPVMFSTFFSDDSFYYYKTAINIRDGLGSSFDGLNITNGYHPLWMMVCVAVSFVTTDIYQYIYVILGVNLFITVLLGLQIIKMFRGHLGVYFSVFVFFIMNWQKKSSCAVFSGLETPLYLLLIFLSVELAMKVSWADKKKLVLLGLLFGLSFLARTSFILFAPIFAFYLMYRFYRDRDRKILNVLLCTGVGAMVIAGPYLAYNYYTFGHFQQVSGLIKTHWRGGAFLSVRNFSDAVDRFMQHMPLILQPDILTLIPVVLLCVFIYVMIKRRQLCGFLKDGRFVLLSAFGLIECFYYFAHYGRLTRVWHCGLGIVVLQIFFVMAMKNIYDSCSDNKVLRRILVICFLFILTDLFFQIPYYRHKYLQPTAVNFEAAEWIKENLPKDCTIGVWDAGVVGYFSQRTVVNLDGLINGIELYEYKRDGRGVYRYIFDKRLDYVGNRFIGERRLSNSILSPGLEEIYTNGPIATTITGKTESVRWTLWEINYEKLSDLE